MVCEHEYTNLSLPNDRICYATKTKHALAKMYETLCTKTGVTQIKGILIKTIR